MPPDPQDCLAAAPAPAPAALPPAGGASLEELPRDPAAERAKEDAKAAAAALAARCAYEEDQATLRALRVALRAVTLALLGDRRWKMFAAPVSPDEDPEYWQLVGRVGAWGLGVLRFSGLGGVGAGVQERKHTAVADGTIQGTY